MTTTPSAAAEQLATELATVLDAIHAHFAGQTGPAFAAAVEQRDFEHARQVVADSEHIAGFVNTRFDGVLDDPLSRMNFSDGSSNAVFELAGTMPIDSMLEDLDPERRANLDRIITELRVAGEWSDDDDAASERERTASEAKYPTVQQ